MIVVRFELWPGGDSRDMETIGQLTITNLYRLGDTCDYEVRGEGRVAHVRHRRADGVLELARLALAALSPLGGREECVSVDGSVPVTRPGPEDTVRYPWELHSRDRGI